ncbi:hypothetical protein SAMN05444397_110132 [Flavobacterium aquidurense]|uniref:Type IV secretion system putative lipoprotein virB7 n=1 Tax=Flavobacterium frigidimaris TaxID=262320 RepID=A0ABX4BNA8_FLAFR|nr:DUF6252 family protein [Flavobacterium frigidimaris]OXA77981.1 hypothetical protein B0A65_14545 [Flavobacterium frigidimaris]SDZ61583.1 hypothetical protein SAMN05444397_110132 [Flavobacterium aquidurense]
MKKIFYFLSLLFVVTSCTEDIKFNNPAFQTLKDNVFWKGIGYKAYSVTNGNMVVEGTLGYEKVILQIPSPIVSTYTLGIDNITKASYSNTFPGQLAEFSTGEDKGNGQIVVTEFNTETNTISGTFRFSAINKDETNTENPKVTFTEGVFYKVPVARTIEY